MHVAITLACRPEALGFGANADEEHIGPCAPFGFKDRHVFTDLQIRLVPNDDEMPTVAWAHRVVLASASPVCQSSGHISVCTVWV